MPAQLELPTGSNQRRLVETTESFKGVDFTTAPADIDPQRSPDTINMISDSKGNPVKRTGFSLVREYGGRINGRYEIGGHEIIHAGNTYYIDGETAYIGGADEKSTGQIIKDKLYIFDGECALMSDGFDIWPIMDEAYIPTLLISKNADEKTETDSFKGDGTTKTFDLNGGYTEISATVGGTAATFTSDEASITFDTAPANDAEIVVTRRSEMEPGGTKLQALNLLSRKWTESFLCTSGTEKIFTLAYGNLDRRKVKVSVWDSDGNWVDKVENTDFTVDRASGKVTFTNPVNATPVTGEDNLKITASRDFGNSEDKINFCKYSITYGENGLQNRIFVCGNPEYPNQDFWCEAGNPTYFPDTYYSELGNNDTRIIGYSILEGYLAAHILPSFEGRSIILRRSSTAASTDGKSTEITFPVEDVMQGEEAFAPRTMIYMEKEPLFLTERGVYAITAADIDGRKYTQNRSYYINKKLCTEPNLSEAEGAKWKQYYILALNGRVYLLDTAQRSYAKGEPLSTSQYECYFWDGIDARVLWEKDGQLFFGDSEGRVCAFAVDFSIASSYHDYTPEGDRAINAFWTFPDFYGRNFWKNKRIRSVSILAAPYPQNEVRLEAFQKGVWSIIKEWTSKVCYFAWSALSFSDFTFSGDTTVRTLTAKVRIKKIDKISFRICCDKADKAFGIYGFAIEYYEGNRFKG